MSRIQETGHGRGLIQIHAIIMAARATAGEVVLRVAVVPCCDASPVLQLAEHPFDQVSAFVGVAVERIGRSS